MKIFPITWFLIIVVTSCVLIRTDDSIDLGGNYRFIQDSPKTIIYHRGREYNGVGIEIIPPIVTAYKFNNHYIIAKSIQVDPNTGYKISDEFLYWIINKSDKDKKQEPLDSTNFHQILLQNKIDLKF